MRISVKVLESMGTTSIVTRFRQGIDELVFSAYYSGRCWHIDWTANGSFGGQGNLREISKFTAFKFVQKSFAYAALRGMEIGVLKFHWSSTGGYTSNGVKKKDSIYDSMAKSLGINLVMRRESTLKEIKADLFTEGKLRDAIRDLEVTMQ